MYKFVHSCIFTQCHFHKKMCWNKNFLIIMLNFITFLRKFDGHVNNKWTLDMRTCSMEFPILQIRKFHRKYDISWHFHYRIRLNFIYLKEMCMAFSSILHQSYTQEISLFVHPGPLRELLGPVVVLILGPYVKVHI